MLWGFPVSYNHLMGKIPQDFLMEFFFWEIMNLRGKLHYHLTRGLNWVCCDTTIVKGGVMQSMYLFIINRPFSEKNQSRTVYSISEAFTYSFLAPPTGIYGLQ